jgi:iron complex outermembrane receptor protein
LSAIGRLLRGKSPTNKDSMSCWRTIHMSSITQIRDDSFTLPVGWASTGRMAASGGLSLVAQGYGGIEEDPIAGGMMSLGSMLLAALGAIVLCGTVTAQVTSQTPITFRIPAQPLADALNQLAQQSGLQILFPSELGAQMRSPELTGSMTADGALRKLLINTGLRFEFINARTVTIFADTHAGSNVGTPESTSSASATQPGIATAATPDSQKDGPTSRLHGLQRSKGSRAGCGSEHPGPACAQDDSVAPGPLDEIIVSARKRNESLAQVPASITVFSSETLQNYDIQSFNDYATKTPNLSFTYGGGPTGIADARTIAIRGITGQNLSGTDGATGFYIDDTPVPSSIDPRILDVDHIEVLKGPQGTLFGEGSLGGNVRIITKEPDLARDEFNFMAQAGVTSGGGSPDGGGSFVGNVALVPDTLAMRVVMFINHDAGYLTRTYPTDPSSPGVSDPFLSVARTSVGDQGAAMSYGGSISTLLKADRLDATLRLMLQSTSDSGFPATFAPLPSFTPIYTIDRAFNVQAHADDQWWLPSLDLKYHGQGWEFVSSSSFFDRHTQDVEDSTYGTQQILTGFYGVCCLPPQPYLWKGEHYEDQVSEEMRVSFDPVHNLSGTVGAFFSKTRSNFTIPPIDATGLVAATANNTVVGPWPNELLWFLTQLFDQRDTSVFGELYYEFLQKFTLTLGARQYWLSQSSNGDAGGFQDFSELHVTPEATNSESGLNPKVGLSYQASDTTMVYASASKGFRAGGAQGLSVFCGEPGLTNEDIEHVKADTLWSYELGTRLHLSEPGLLLSADIFHIDWQNPQQQLALPCGNYFDINGRAATVNGGEFDISGHLTSSLSVRMGAGFEKGVMTEPGALIYAGIRPGSRILGTPAWNASMGGAYTHRITRDIDGFLSADYSYTGCSDALINGGNGAVSTRPAYYLLNMRFGIGRGQTEVSLNIRNLTNAKPNLGDIGYVGYAQYSNTGTVIPQVATLQPLTVLLQYRKSF